MKGWHAITITELVDINSYTLFANDVMLNYKQIRLKSSFTLLSVMKESIRSSSDCCSINLRRELKNIFYFSFSDILLQLTKNDYSS